MHLGIKIGPGNWDAKLDNGLHIAHAEVYFDLDRLPQYRPMFDWLQAHGIHAGLHASTMLDDGLTPNLAVQDVGVRRASIDLLRRTIDVAAGERMHFVVVHPGSYRACGVRGGRTILAGEPTPPELGDRLLIEAMCSLAAAGRAQGIEVLAENMPGRDYISYEPLDRGETVDVGFVPYTVLRTLGELGVSLCLDVGHLYAERMAYQTGLDPAQWVMAVTPELVPYTTHVHLSTTVPPWNGSDSHSGFLPADYALGAVPGREQLLAWLGLFDGREVLAIPEPAGGTEVHLENYRTLQAWLEQRP